MNKIGRLIKNELLKKIKQPSTIVLAAIFIVISFIMPFLIYLPYGGSDWYEKDDRIDWEIRNLNERLSYIDNNAPEYAKGQYTNAIEFLEKAKEFKLQPTDWRMDMLFNIYFKVRANYEIALILDGTVNPKLDPENPNNKGIYLENYSNLFYSDIEINEDQIRIIYNTNKVEIDSVWQVIEKNDYKFYCQKQIESYEMSVSMTEQQIEEQKAQIEAKPYDYNLKLNLKQLELSLENLKLQIEIATYRIDNSVPFDNEWQDQTLNIILQNKGIILSSKLQLFELENKKNIQDDYYYYLRFSIKDKTIIAEKTIIDYEERNKISWYSLEKDIPYIHNIEDSRSFSLNYFSMTMFAAIIALFIASNIVSGEFSTKTINMLIIRPVKRWKIITAKFITVLIFSYAIFILGMVANLISSGISFGFGSFSIPYLFVSGDTVHSVNFIIYMLQNLLFCSINIVFLVTLVFMMSTLTKNTALSAISGMGVYFLCTILYQILLYAARTPISVLKYTIFPYFDPQSFIIKNDYFDEINYLLLPEFGAVLFLVLSAAMFTISLIVFNRRDVK